MHAAERAALVFDLEQADDVRLARIGQCFERVDVAGAQRPVFAVEQRFEFGERGVLIGEQAPRRVASQDGIHCGVPVLLVRGDGGEQVHFEAHHLVGDPLRIDVIAAFVHRAAHRIDAGSR